MITWVLGRSGVGKTAYLRQQIPTLTKEYRQVLYLVPEQGSMTLEQELGDTAVKVVSFRRLCNEIFRTFGGVAGRYMTEARSTALIYRVLQEQQKNLRYYRKARLTMGFVERLSTAFSEFSVSGLTREQVLPVLEKDGRADRQDKYHDLFLLYETYCAALDEENRSAGEDLAVATALAAEKGYFRDTAVLIDGFFGFTGRQRELLQVLFQQSEAVWCALLLDPEDSSMLFSSAKKEWAALQRLAAELPTQTVTLQGPSKRLLHADLQALEQNLFSLRPQAVEPRHLRLMMGRNIREELSMVAADIAKKVREQGFRYRDFALVAGHTEEYGPIAETVFAKYGIPLFVDRGNASLGKPLFSLVQSALRMVSPERYFRREDVLIFLKTGLCGESRDLVSRLENYCTLWQMDGERFLRDADWTQNPLGAGKITEEGEALLAELNGLRKRFREPLLRFKERVAAGTGRALAEAVYGLLCDLRVKDHIARLAEEAMQKSGTGEDAWEHQKQRRLSREYLRLYGVMVEILDDIYLVFEERPLSLRAMEELVGLCGERVLLNVVPPTQDAVTLGEVAHSRLNQIRFLYVVGANRGILPVPVGDSGLITDGERCLFAEHSLPCNATLQQNTVQGQYRLYATLFSAQEGITFSYSAFKSDGTPLLPSSYVEQLRRVAGLIPITRSEMELYDFALTPAGARELTGWEPALRQAILDELQEQPLPPRDPEEALPEAVTRRIFGNRLRLSYSQISLYQNCPFHYFMEKTLRIKKLEPVTFDTANIGTFIHYGLEKLVNRIKAEGGEFGRYGEAEIRSFGEALAREYLQDQLRDLNRTNRFAALYRRMTNLFCLVAGNVVSELSESGFRPYATEFSLENVVLPLARGGEVQLIGSVDRVDVYHTEEKDYLKVTDYKTGSKTFDFCGITNRDNVQLPIYLYGLCRSGVWEHPVPAAACYMEAKMPSFDAPVPPEELAESLQRFYRRNGAFLDDRVALAALDCASGSNHHKIRYTASGSLYKDSKVYPAALMQEMTDYMETVLKETAEGILGGEVRAVPLVGSEHNACRYCDFAALCGHDPRCGKARIYSNDPEEWRKKQ